MIRVTVLGSCGTYPEARRACSGYLVEEVESGTKVWVDTGAGTFVNLLRSAELADLDAIWVSHLHIDHVSDLPVAGYALHFGPAARRVPVYGPPGWAEHVGAFMSPGSTFPLDEAFEVRELRDGMRVGVGGLELVAHATLHSVETFGLRASAGGQVLGYSADSGPCEGLRRIAEHADLFLCEAAWAQWPVGAASVHLTPNLAGRLARSARARRLVLTHLRPGVDRQLALDRAREAYGGEVGLAVEHDVFEVGAPEAPAAAEPAKPRGAGAARRRRPNPVG